MPVKMIVTDLDGTLLRSDKTVSAYTERVFGECRKKGIKVIFATARPIRTVKMMNLNIQADAVAYHNGAVIDMTGAICLRSGIQPEMTRHLLLAAIALFPGMRISVEIDDVLYANFDAASVWAGIASVFSDFTDLPENPADKIIFDTADRAEVSEIRKLLPENLYGDISDNQLLMVMHVDARKVCAVREAAAYFRIPLAEVAAFGDDHNDVEMLRACGYGTAVANAIAEAKAAAGYVCDSNDNDGVAKWLELHVL